MAARRGSGDGTLFKNSKGYWVGGIELPPGPDGKRRVKRIQRRDRNEAMAALRQIRKDYEAGALALAPSTTVEKWLDYWFPNIHEPTVKPTTAIAYSNTIRLYIKPTLGAKKIDRLQPADIRAAYIYLQDKVSTRAAQKADQVLRLAIKAAVREGVVGRNIMERVTKPDHVKKEQRAIDAATAVHLIRVADETLGPVWAARWLAGFMLGVRESEILGMEWNRVHFDAGVVDISWQLQRMQKRHGCGTPINGAYPCKFKRVSFCPQAHWKFPAGMEWRECERTLVFTRPKTKTGKRLIPLTPLMAAALELLPRDTPHGLVFHEKGHPISQDRDQKAWKQLLIDAKVPHLPQHSLRHSTATMGLELGISDHVLQSRLGHSDIVTTRGYQHVDMQLASTEWAKFDDLFRPKQIEN